MIYVEAPNKGPVGGTIPSLFLAGAITGAPQWQDELVKDLENLNLVVYNPRRKNFPIHDPSAAAAQIKWEFDNLRKASMISFWFCKETMGPIVLFELGAHLMTPKPIVIGMDPGYQRRQDVEIQTKLIHPEIEIVYSLKDLGNQIALTYNQVLPYL
jgi:hypothetical protein